MPQLQHQLANNHQKFQRYYYALVHGKLSQKQGQINAPMAEKKIVSFYMKSMMKANMPSPIIT